MLPGVDVTFDAARHPNNVGGNGTPDYAGFGHDHRTGQVKLALYDAFHLNHTLTSEGTGKRNALRDDGASGPGRRRRSHRLLLLGERCDLHRGLCFLHSKQTHDDLTFPCVGELTIPHKGQNFNPECMSISAENRPVSRLCYRSTSFLRNRSAAAVNVTAAHAVTQSRCSGRAAQSPASAALAPSAPWTKGSA